MFSELKNKYGKIVLKALNGCTLGIIVGMMPNAVLATFLKPFVDVPLIDFLLNIVIVNQYFTGLYVGFAMAHAVGLNTLQSACTAAAAYIGSGAWTVTEQWVDGTFKRSFAIAGVGDVVNIILIAFLAIVVLKLVAPYLKSLSIVLLPIISVFVIGYIGTLTYPYVSCVTGAIGNMINYFTTLNPFVASILIAITYSILIITPISTVATSMAIGIAGMSSAAAGMGAFVASAYTIIATAHVNKPGVPITIALGGVKMLIPNFLTHPIMGLPIAFVSAICSLSVPLFGMQGTPASAGFGITGLVSPLAALDSGAIDVFGMIIFWIIIPFALSFIVEFICRRIIKLYNPEIFKYEM